MFKIDLCKKEIIFQNNYREDEAPKKILRLPLINAYICPECGQILYAVFKTDSYVKIWEYDDEEDRKITTKSDLRYYRYRIFSINSYQGIELKEHNSEHSNDCSFKYIPSFNLLYSVSEIIDILNCKADKYNEHKFKKFRHISKITDPDKLLKVFRKIPHTQICGDICRNENTLVSFDYHCIKYESIDTWELKTKKEKEKAEMKNFRAKLKAFTAFYNSLLDLCDHNNVETFCLML